MNCAKMLLLFSIVLLFSGYVGLPSVSSSFHENLVQEKLLGSILTAIPAIHKDKISCNFIKALVTVLSILCSFLLICSFYTHRWIVRIFLVKKGVMKDIDGKDVVSGVYSCPGLNDDSFTYPQKEFIEKTYCAHRERDEVKELEKVVTTNAKQYKIQKEPDGQILNEMGVNASYEIEIEKCVMQLELMVKGFLLSLGIDVKFCIQTYGPKNVKVYVPTAKIQQIILILITNMANSLKRMNQDTKRNKDIISRYALIHDTPTICLCITHSRKWIQFDVHCENHIFPDSNISNIGMDIIRRIMGKCRGEITCNALSRFRLKIPIVCNEISCDGMHYFSFPMVVAVQDATSRRMLSKMLQKAGFQHVTACSTKQELHNITNRAISSFLLISSSSILSSNQTDLSNTNQQILIQLINPQSNSILENGCHSQSHAIIMLKPIYIQGLIQNIYTSLDENLNKFT